MLAKFFDAKCAALMNRENFPNEIEFETKSTKKSAPKIFPFCPHI